ncbi:MAG TPA: DinB family protein [Flavobacteriaceae bacterium]|nr:DinB family protein [Flavobacteriaceae bacterium]MCB9212464.1 DinB family protein [Alteromonas sp.]HPF10527.1 DinB family protein [Flavobacteriaceae bacterium]HQU20215.1 DinB family protein [Flavobacteriaceae bacterium]HQU66043.1 DinB family protein [Flavobacteriaceae bacterium]
MNDPKNIAEEFSKNLERFRDLLENCTAEERNWKPSPSSWCLLELLGHLYDEECFDFRARIQHLFEHPNTAPPPIDPQGWVETHAYLKQDYGIAWKRFAKAREESLLWLQKNEEGPWQNEFNHPHFGRMSAALFLTNWLAHDYFHLRQIYKIKALFLEHHRGHSINYAGGL